MNFESMKKFMNKLTDWVIPGNSAVVYKDGEKVFEYSTGYSDLENKTEMTADDLIYIYSCSKVTTVAAALQLYERGEFLLSDPLYEYIPEFKDMYLADGEKKAKAPITMRDLFTMTAGLSYNCDTPAFSEAKRLTDGKMDTLTVVKCLAKEPLLFEPGCGWNYSLCHDVLAAAVEVISGKRFSQYVKENIFDPLDMNSSCYHDYDKTKMAQQYIYDTGGARDVVTLQNSSGDRGVIKNAGEENSLVFGENYDSGGAGIVTTVNDYAKLAAALANKGMGLNKNRILAEGTVELLKTNQLNSVQMKDYNWRRLAGYGYGLGVRTMLDRSASGSNGSVGEFGWGGAAGANVIMDTDLNLAVFYAHHMLNPQEEYYQPRLRNVVYTSIGS
ncbi:MAG: serine hydrolase [Clostridiales bacterium]|nr:serine hydrolase [Clostridiales bacterium]